MLAVVLTLAVVIGGYMFERRIASRPGTYAISDHFDGRKFFNPDVSVQMESDRTKNKSIWMWMLTKNKRGTWEQKDVTQARPPQRVHEGIRVTYVNHATVLLQFSGINIITDPVFSYRASPFPFFGPARYADPGVRLEHLPPIDIVLLSHNHYDHMDLQSLRSISERFKPEIYTSLGNAAYLSRFGIKGAIDMDWWDTKETHGIRLVATPARHFAARTFSDRNYALWCGFMLETQFGPVYFAGDTGFGTFIKQIEERYESISLALLPIGAYEPAWMMHLVHMNPEEALRTFERLNVKSAVAIHHGTFRLTDEPQSEPRQRIEAGRGDKDFRVFENGESAVFMPKNS